MASNEGMARRLGTVAGLLSSIAVAVLLLGGSTVEAAAVDGYVTDSGHGYPLYAQVVVSQGGDQVASAFTDPFNGYFEVNLADNQTFDFSVTAVYPGYVAATRSVVVVDVGQTVGFVLVPDESCTAPGYAMGAPCVAMVGGLVAGFVTDGNTATSLDGAVVVDDVGGRGVSQATPADGALADGFYYLFTAVPGEAPLGPATRTVTASKAGYAAVERSVTVVLNAVNRLDFALPAGLLQLAPGSLEERLNPGEDAHVAMTLSNLGAAAAPYSLFVLPTAAWVPNRPQERPAGLLVPVEASRTVRSSLRGVAVASRPAAPALAGGDVVQSWPTGVASPWGLGYDQQLDRVWVSSIGLGSGDDLDYEYTRIGASTGGTIDTTAWNTNGYAADMAYDAAAGTLWEMDVRIGDPQVIVELDPVSHQATGSTIQVHGLSTYRTGLAYDPVSDTFFIGGWNDGMVYRFGRDGVVVQSKSVGLAIAGLAYNPSTQHLFVIENSGTDAVTVLDVANDYAAVGSFVIAGFGGYAAAGLEFDCSGALWAVNQNDGRVYEVESGEVGTCPWASVAWLMLSPAAGSVEAAGSTAIDAHFVADGAPRFGLVQGRIKAVHNTPYAVNEVPVCFTKAFLDVPAGAFGESFIHGMAGAGITQGCGGGNFCPDALMTRGSMAPWLLTAKFGAGYVPPSCAGIFADVPCSNPLAPWVEALYNQGITAGCNADPLRYCPGDPVTRSQMAVFLLKAKEGSSYTPPACTGLFSDVPCPDGFAVNWIEELFNRGITSGCGTGLFCPANSNLRNQMAVFVTKTWSIPTCQ